MPAETRSISLTGQDVFQYRGSILNDLANENAIELTFDEDLVNVEASKNGNVIAAFRENGKKVMVTVRLLLGSPDDKLLQSDSQTMINDFAAFIPVTANFVKRAGDGTGNINNVNYTLIAGFLSRGVDTFTSASGEVNQSVAVYRMVFGNFVRTIQ